MKKPTNPYIDKANKILSNFTSLGVKNIGIIMDYQFRKIKIWIEVPKEYNYCDDTGEKITKESVVSEIKKSLKNEFGNEVKLLPETRDEVWTKEKSCKYQNINKDIMEELYISIPREYIDTEEISYVKISLDLIKHMNSQDISEYHINIIDRYKIKTKKP